jgi:type I restriction enzyme S subunit
MKYPIVQLGEVCEFIYGDGLKEANRKGGKVPVYGSNGIIGWHDKPLTKGETIIVGRKGSIGEVHLCRVPCWPIDTTYYIERGKVPCDFTWLYYMLIALDLTGLNKSAAVPGLNRDDAYEQKLPLPPLAEQRRIAALLGKADRLRRLRRTARQLGETVLQSVFVEMFGEPETNPKKWELVKLAEKMTFITSGSRGWAEYYSDKGALFLRVQNVGANRLLLNDVAYVQPPDTAESRRTRVQSGDLLISATADIGRTGVIPDNFPEAYINQHLFLIRLKDINPVFAAGYFSTPSGKAQILRLDREGVKSGLNFDDAKGLIIFNPPISDQERFVAIVEKFERLCAQQREAERQAEMLFQGLLGQAFGEKNGNE